MRVFICTALTIATLLAAPAAMAERDDGPSSAPGWLMAIDFIFVRPPSVLVSVASTGLFVGTLPITYWLGASTGPHSLPTYMVTAPWRFATSRYYGNFSDYRDHRTILGAEIRD